MLPIPPAPITASGGVISDYTDLVVVYRAHVFTSSGCNIYCYYFWF